MEYRNAGTKCIGRELNKTRVWQRNYYERIIRDEREMDRIWGYIESNPSKWANDDENL